MAGGPGDWDAATYHRVAAPQEEWGLKVLARLELGGDETVLDAGCGSGRMTGHILGRVPLGKVIGVDASPTMIQHATEELTEAVAAGRVELIVRDLLDLELPEPVDAVFSNAAFHWVLDHDRLFARLFATLRPGGALEAQFGGTGNVGEFQDVLMAVSGDERFAPYLRTMPATWNFARLPDTDARLRRGGFEVRRLWVEELDTQPDDPRAWLIASGLSRHLALLPEELHEPFVDALLESSPRPLTLHHVRLNVSARRSE